MTLFVDTSVWSLALRRDAEANGAEVQALKGALAGDAVVVTTGLVLQELLQGFSGAKASQQIVERFTSLALVQPDRDDHVAAAGLRNTCRRAGVQLGTVDALIAQLCLRHEMTLLSTDQDFVHAARHCALEVWSPKGAKPRR
ncbi:MAG: PIN domain-containing protein [Acidobacteria bacterium]|nr:PIN domain-containing protein [Acidobacteriota bacterium]